MKYINVVKLVIYAWKLYTIITMLYSMIIYHYYVLLTVYNYSYNYIL